MKKKINVLKLTRVALSVAFISIGAMLSFPTTPAFSLQTLCIFIVSVFLTPTEALWAGFVYILLGIVGLPIFSNFGSGIGVILSLSGGFIISFPLVLFIISKMIRKFQKTTFVYAFVFGVATLITYVFGAIWIEALNYYDGTFLQMLPACILPFIPFDALKIFVAILCIKKLGSALGHNEEKNNSSKNG
ncbi:MAG: biotin transporter BioY [Ruminococcaceae bacterium]|nr:biotin transporter BioY [Oscillospiraceae bacterium]